MARLAFFCTLRASFASRAAAFAKAPKRVFVDLKTDRYLIIYPFLLECRFARVAGSRGATFGAGLFGGGARLLPFNRATSAFSFAISAAAARGSEPHTTSLHLVANWKLETLSATFACAGELQTNIIVFAEPPTESDMSIVRGWFL